MIKPNLDEMSTFYVIWPGEKVSNHVEIQQTRVANKVKKISHDITIIH